MKRWISAFLILFLLGATASCQRAKSKSASEILEQEMQGVESLPAGEIYRSGRNVWESGYFSPSLMASMYGKEAEERTFPLIEEYAIYLSSFPNPCEISVFRCFSKTDVDRVAEMCLSRKETLRIGLAGMSLRARADAATVEVQGRTVIFRMTP